MNNNQLKNQQNVSVPPINLMGAISRCTIFRLKLEEIKNQLPSNIFNDIVVTPVFAQDFNEAFTNLSNIVDTVYRNNSNDYFLRASYIVQGEQYLQIVKDHLKQIQVC